jgi:hypothetical protein
MAILIVIVLLAIIVLYSLYVKCKEQFKAMTAPLKYSSQKSKITLDCNILNDLQLILAHFYGRKQKLFIFIINLLII